MNYELTAIDPTFDSNVSGLSGLSGPAVYALRGLGLGSVSTMFEWPGAYTITSVHDMVDGALARLGVFARVDDSPRISRLNIVDHGNPSSMQIGDDRMSDRNYLSFLTDLSRLRPHFSGDGFVHLQHCKIGNNQMLLCGLARIFNVPVYAGQGLENQIYRFNLGDYVRADPDGLFVIGVSRP